MGPYEKWARDATDKLTAETLCANRWLNLRTADHPDVYTPEEIADSVEAAKVYGEAIRETRRWVAALHLCTRCSDV